jgi:TonB-linked SusC/RagA family outer membrane protein
MGKIAKTNYALSKVAAVIVMLHFFLFSNAQDSGNFRITVFASNVPLRSIFKRIEKQTNFRFSYSESELNANAKISVKYENIPLNSILSDLLVPIGFEWKYIDKSIYLRKRTNPAKIKPLKDTINSQFINGNVFDENGNALSGVTILVKGTKKGTKTDEEGRFHLDGLDENAIISVTYIGYKGEEFLLNDRRNISIRLEQNVGTLDETVIIAYGTTTKRFNTGTIGTVKGEDIKRQPVSNPLAALQGRVSGLYIQQQTGVPGGDFVVRLRGQNSIQNGNNPLYIVDGVPFTSTSLSNNSFLGVLNNPSPLNYLNPSEIESIDVLKDADATAIYGSRGANGVILISTKKGKIGQAKININVYRGIGKVSRMMNLLNTQQYLKMRHEAYANDNSIPDASAYDINGTWDTTRYTDWQKVLIGGTAKYTDVQGSISGGNSNTQFLVGGGYHKETTVFPGDNADEKISSHFSLTHTSLNQKFGIVFSANYLLNNSNLPNIDLTRQALITLAPDAPSLYNPDGTLNWENSTWTNPLSYLSNRYSAKANNLISRAIISYEIISDLQAKVNLGYTNTTLRQENIFPRSANDPFYLANYSQYITGQSYFANTNTNTWIIEPQISYRKRIGKGILDLLMGSTFQKNILDVATISASGFTSDAFIKNVALAPNKSINNSYTDYRYCALFGRVNYNLNQKYLINLTARRDGSSRFGPGKRFGNFGAIGAGWIFSKEEFISNAFPWLSFGKLRGSYGLTGNDQTQDYQYLNTFSPSTGSISYQGISGLVPTGIFNPNFGWETNRKLEVALELGLLKDKILFSVNYYKNRSSNQLVGYPLPPTTGGSSIVANLPATVENTGFEFDLNTKNLNSIKFTWSTSINLSLPRNKLVSYPNLIGSSYANTYVIGQSLFVQKLYLSKGVDPQTGIYTFATKNPNGEPSSPDDLQRLKNVTQEFFGGLQNHFRYKAFELDILFQFVKQTGRNYLYTFSLPGIDQNRPIEVLDRWQKTGDNTTIQKFTQNFGSLAGRAFSNIQRSDATICDASYIRLKNLSLSYELSLLYAKKLHIQNSRIYLQGQNLFTFTKYIGLDPEQPFIQNLPSLKVLTVGIQFTL